MIWDVVEILLMFLFCTVVVLASYAYSLNERLKLSKQSEEVVNKLEALLILEKADLQREKDITYESRAPKRSSFDSSRKYHQTQSKKNILIEKYDSQSESSKTELPIDVVNAVRRSGGGVSC